jgi:hypothetical protein
MYGRVGAIQLSALEARHEQEQWKARPDVRILCELRITTLSGRQAEIRDEEVHTNQVIQIPGPGGASGTVFKTNTISSGETLQILPIVAGDGFHIAFIGEASVSEFLGYDEPGMGAAPGGKWDTRLSGQDVVVGGPTQAAFPIARFRIRKVPIGGMSVADGQTLVLGYPQDGDGKPAEIPNDGKKRLLVFITPTVIDPTGNRAHTEEEVERATRQGTQR